MITKYFKGSILVLFFGLILAVGISYWQSGSTAISTQAGLTALLLAVLEISLSFDNAVVNATIIKKMTPIWKQRFLTWGMLIAVFGMRLLFPLIIVAIIAHINPISALLLSFSDPVKYAEIMTSAHTSVSSFGGMFLFMVFIHFFMNADKEDHWIHFIEKPLKKISEFKGIEIAISLGLLIFVTSLVEAKDSMSFLLSGIWGVITFLIVHSLANWLEDLDLVNDANSVTKSGGFGLFLYLEVLDASFSFDGVIGAFALTNSLIQIMIGLSIGAFFVRSLTIYFVEQDTLNQFRFLEHGAFYALGALALLMLFGSIFHIPEWATGLTGAFILVASVFWSIYSDRKERTT
jgi:uncharacterized protein